MRKRIHLLCITLLCITIALIVLCALSPSSMASSQLRDESSGGAFGGSFGVVCKEQIGSEYQLTLVYSNGLLAWAYQVFFCPPPTPLQKELWNEFPFYTAKIIAECSKKDFDSVKIGDWIDADGILHEPYITKHKTGKLERLSKNYGPMIYQPDGLILWLYRDLPEE